MDPGLFQRRFRRIHIDHFSGAAFQCSQTETSGVAEAVQHLGSGRHFRAHDRTVDPLIKVKSGLVPGRRIALEPEAVFGKIDLIRQRTAAQQTFDRIQSLASASVHIGPLINPAGRIRHERIGDLIPETVGSGSRKLDHRILAVNIGDDPGKTVRFGVNKPVSIRQGTVENRFAQFISGRDLPLKKSRIHSFIGIMRPDPDRDG